MVSAEMMISSSAQSFATALAFSALTRATSCSGGSDGSICSSMSAVCTVNSSPRSFRSSCRRGDLDAKIMDIKNASLLYASGIEASCIAPGVKNAAGVVLIQNGIDLAGIFRRKGQP